jgi:hypothetical protein
MHIDQLYPSRFLRCADLDGRPMRVTIAGISREDISGEQKVVMAFSNGAKKLILNKTNARAIARILGNETRAWAGHDILLTPAEVDFKGDLVPSIRVKSAPAQKSAAPVAADEVPFDDDPNFQI